MPNSTKQQIAEAAITLLTKKKQKKLTVKTIVEECNITRQAFYYHFEDIPHLFRWILEEGSQKILKEIEEQESPEQSIKYFFLMAINAGPYVKKSMESNYRNELEQLLTDYFYHLIEELIRRNKLYQNQTFIEVDLMIRYHCYAILGLLRSWKEEDTQNLDQIVHWVASFITKN